MRGTFFSVSDAISSAFSLRPFLLYDSAVGANATSTSLSVMNVRRHILKKIGETEKSGKELVVY